MFSDNDGKLEVSPTELHEMNRILDRPPAIFVFGQSRASRNFLVNEILGRQLLPLLSTPQEATAPLKVLVLKQDGKIPPNIIETLSKNCTPLTWSEIMMEESEVLVTIIIKHMGTLGDRKKLPRKKK